MLGDDPLTEDVDLLRAPMFCYRCRASLDEPVQTNSGYPVRRQYFLVRVSRPNISVLEATVCGNCALAIAAFSRTPNGTQARSVAVDPQVQRQARPSTRAKSPSSS